MTDFKICNVCLEKQTLEYFNKRPDGRGGYRAVCKKCMTKKASKYYFENRGTIIYRRKILKELKTPIGNNNEWDME